VDLATYGRNYFVDVLFFQPSQVRFNDDHIPPHGTRDYGSFYNGGVNHHHYHRAANYGATRHGGHHAASTSAGHCRAQG
jgi:hypothetical protein